RAGHHHPGPRGQRRGGPGAYRPGGGAQRRPGRGGDGDPDRRHIAGRPPAGPPAAAPAHGRGVRRGGARRRVRRRLRHRAGRAGRVVRIVGGMLPRGEVALIVAGVGLSSGVIGGEVFGVAILLVLVTTVLASALLAATFRVPAAAPPTRDEQAEQRTLQLGAA